MYSTFLAYIFFFLSGFGVLGFHRFYLGKIGTGFLWMFTAGLGMFGSFYDFFTLPSQVREANIRQAIINESANNNAENRHWRNVDDGRMHIIGNKESIEHAILKLAKANKGILTASELALSAHISIEESKRDLDAMVSKGFAELRVRQSGSLVYTIPDLMDSNEPLVD